jgi:hypothetical protein
MSVSPDLPLQTYTVSGIGPYAITWPFRAGTLVAAIVDAGTVTPLNPDQFTLDPPATATSANFFFEETGEVAAAFAGKTLRLTRATPALQGWAAQWGEREAGLEVSLDTAILIIQELQAALTLQQTQIDTLIAGAAPA